MNTPDKGKSDETNEETNDERGKSPSDEDLRLLADSARDFAMIFTDLDRCIVRWSAGAESVLGWTEAEALGHLCDIIFTPEDRAAGVPAQEAETALREGRAEDERWHVKKDGTRFWGSGVKRPLYDEAGTLRGFGKVLRDVTERKRLEDNFRSTADELRALFDSTLDALLVADDEATLLDANPAACALLGQERGEIVGQKVSDLFPEETRAEAGEMWQEFLARGEMEGVVRITRADGSEIDTEFRARAHYVPNRHLSILRDVTERKRAEESLRVSTHALRESEDRLALVFETLPVGVGVVNIDGALVLSNREMRRYLPTGVLPSVDDSRYMRWRGHHPDGRPMERQDFPGARARRGESVVPGAEMLYTQDDGREVWVRFAAVPIRDEESRITGHIAVIADIDEMKRIQKAVQRANELLEVRVAERTAQLQRVLAALEALLSERQGLVARLINAQEEERRRISHELHDEMGQLLTGFALGLKSLEEAVTTNCPPDSGAEKTVWRLRTLAEQMGREVHRLAVELRPTALDDLGLLPSLESYVQAWSARTGVVAELVTIGQVKDRLSPLVETTVYRVVQEALNNAAKYAVPDGATRLDVTLQRIEGHLQVTVEDDGAGFDMEEAMSRGRLGLIGMRERAELIGGTLEVESAPGEGCTIFLRVPVNPISNVNPSGNES